jgi:hypothetical protein
MSHLLTCASLRRSFLNNHNTKTSVPSLLSPWTTHTLDLGEIRIAEQHYLLPNGRSIASRVDLWTPVINPLRNRNPAFATGSTVRALGFRLDITSLKSPADLSRQVDIDLRPLPSLYIPSLNRVAITLRFGTRHRGDNAIIPKLREAVEELGPMLLGGSARMELRETSTERVDFWAYAFYRTS